MSCRRSLLRHLRQSRSLFHFFFFSPTAPTEIYTLSLHDALPISPDLAGPAAAHANRGAWPAASPCPPQSRDRKSTRLNSSHANISYAVFCLKKKNNNQSKTECHLKECANERQVACSIASNIILRK